MPFPLVSNSSTGVQSANTLTHGVVLPTVSVGQLLYVAISFDGAPVVTWDNSTAGTWTSYVDTANGTANKLVIRAKVAVGNEGGLTLNITTGTSEQSVYRAVAISDWEGTLAGGFNCPAAATGTTANPDPPLATDTWGSVDRKTVAIQGTDVGRAVTVWPSGYTLNQFDDLSGGGAGCGLAAAGRNATEAAQNPGQFTVAASDQWVAATISIRGGTAGVPAQTLTQSTRFDNTPSFPAATVTPGAVTLSQDTRFDGAPSFPAATVTQAGAAQTLTQATPFSHAPVATDNFNRADGGLGADYTSAIGAGLLVSGNTCAGFPNAERGSLRTAESYDADQYVEFTLASESSSWVGAMLRTTGADSTRNGYMADAGANNTAYISRYVNGVGFNIVDGTTHAWSPGDRVRAEIIGYTINLYRNGVLVESGTDDLELFATGAPGLYTYSDPTLDDAEFGNVNAPTLFYAHTLTTEITLAQATRFDGAPSFPAATVTTTITVTQASRFDGASTFPAATVTQAGAQLYYVIGPDAGWIAPSAAQVKTGLLGGGGAATAAGSEAAPSVTTEFTFSSPATGLTSSTNYRVAFVWSDGVGDSNVSVSAAFATTGTLALTQSSRFDASPSFPAATVTATITLPQATRFDNAPGFPTATVTATVALTQSSRFDGTPAFPAATVAPGAVVLVASRFDAAPTFYASAVIQDGAPQTLTASRFDGAPVFPAATVTTGAVSLTASRFDAAPTFYTHAATATVAVQQAARFDGAPIFYAATATPGAAPLTAGRFDAAPTFYVAAVSLGSGPITLTASRFDAEPAFPAATVTWSITLSQSSRFDAAPTFYAPSLTSAVTITATRFDAAPTFYASTVTTGPVALTAARFDAAPAFPAATVTLQGAPQTLTASRFDAAPVFPAATVTQVGPPLTLTASRFDAAPAFPAATVTSLIEVVQSTRFDAGQIFYGAVVADTGPKTVSQSTRFDGSATFFGHLLTAPPLTLPTSRFFTINAENRALTINAENRTRTINAEDRTASFNAENRTEEF